MSFVKAYAPKGRLASEGIRFESSLGEKGIKRNVENYLTQPSDKSIHYFS